MIPLRLERLCRKEQQKTETEKNWTWPGPKVAMGRLVNESEMARMQYETQLQVIVGARR